MSKRVLIVEDDPLNMRLVNDLLVSRGYKVSQAGTAREAIRLTYARHPDLILMDFHLPDGSGLDVTRRLKQDDRTKDIPIIALTASVHGEDQAEARKSGCDAFLAKPVAVNEFLRIVSEFLSRVSDRNRSRSGGAG